MHRLIMPNRKATSQISLIINIMLSNSKLVAKRMLYLHFLGTFPEDVS